MLRQNRIHFLSLLSVSTALMFLSAEIDAAEIPITEFRRAEPVSFEKEILPVLQANCLACHSATEKQGDLILETPAQMLKGGDSGPAIVAGKPDESLLLKLAAHVEEPVMPPQKNDVAAKNLTSTELGLLKLWISQGARSSGPASALSPKSWQPLPKGVQPVLDVALSPDGQFVACARANQICLYHVGTGQLVTRMSDPSLNTDGYTGIAHRDLVQSLAFNADGDLLASGGFREIKLWRRPRDVQKLNLATSGNARVLRVSPDRKLLAINTSDHTIQIRSITDGAILQTLSGHTADVTGIRFSSDGQRIYSSSLDSSVLVHEVGTGVQLEKIAVPSPVHDVELVSVQTATDENPHPPIQIVTAGADNVARVWSIPDSPPEGTEAGKYIQVAEFKSHSQPITCLCAVPGRPLEVLSGSRDASMRWWRTANGQQVRSFSHGGAVVAVAAAPDGQTYASAGANNSAKLWRTNGQQIAEVRGDIRLQTAIARAQQQQNSAESRVAVAKRQLEDAEKDVPKKTEAEKKSAETLKQANADAAEKTAALDKAKASKIEAEQAAVALATAVREMQAARDAAQQSADVAADRVKQLQQRAAKLQLAVNAATGNEALKKLLADTQTAVQEAQKEAQQKSAAMQEPAAGLKAATDKANAAAQKIDQVQKPYNDSLAALNKSQAAQNLAAQQHALATTELKQATELVPLRKKAGEQAEALLKTAQQKVEQAEQAAKAAEQQISTLTFSPDGKQLLTAGALQIIHSWDAATGAAIASWEGHSESVNAVAWPDPEVILSVADDQTVRSWQTNPGWRLERTIGSVSDATILSHRVTAVDFSLDSTLLLAGSGVPSRNGELHVFKVADGTRTLSLPTAHDDAVYAAKFSPDASRIASVGADRYLRTFESGTGTQLRRFEGHTNYVLGVAWQSNGQVLASSSADNTVKIWDVETGDQRRTVSNFKRHVTGLQFSGTSDNIICVGGDRTVRMVRASNGGTLRSFSGAVSWMHCTSLTPDGKIAAAGDAVGNVFLWNTANGRLLHTLSKPDDSE